MNKKIIYFTPLILFIIGLKEAYAHCPLCTIGAAAAAGTATLIGVDKIVVGIFIGAFAMSMGMWMARLIKKRYIPFQKIIVVLAIFLSTVLPIMPVIGESMHPVYLHIMGNYGTLLNRTYVLNLFFVGSLIGGLVVALSPKISRKIIILRGGKIIPYQGVIITLSLLTIISIIFQLVM